MIFLRILGANPSDKLTSVRPCNGGRNCPAILEIQGGDFAVIGEDITEAAAPALLDGSGCGPTERIVKIPRSTLVAARPEIPTSL